MIPQSLKVRSRHSDSDDQPYRSISGAALLLLGTELHAVLPLAGHLEVKLIRIPNASPLRAILISTLARKASQEQTRAAHQATILEPSQRRNPRRRNRGRATRRENVQ